MSRTPGWESAADVVVVGSGVAGLTAALDCAAAGRSVVVLTKGAAGDSNTQWAQGGVAVVRAEHDPGDSIDAHVTDTLVAGAGLSDPVAVALILAEGPAAIARLQARGARFDLGGSGLLRTREGGHSADRVIHAGGDATGAEIQRALLAVPGLPAVLAGHQVLDVVLDGAGRAAGVTVLDAAGRVGLLRAGAVVLATGGAGHLYSATTNPAVATADGLAMALRAGAELADPEFMQFHPTVLWTGPGETGHRPLVTEAVRGEGAVLVDGAGDRVMPGVHPLADLAPRDVVSLAITRRLAGAPGGISDHVFLDATGIPAATFRRRFPTVSASCAAAGIDPAVDPIPVAPAAHYHCGGVRTDLWGRTTVPQLYAIGEVARTGLHGANRLASNSLLEGLVMGERVASALARGGAPAVAGTLEIPAPAVADPAGRVPLQTAMSRWVGIGRDVDGLDRALLQAELSAAGVRPTTGPPGGTDGAAVADGPGFGYAGPVGSAGTGTAAGTGAGAGAVETANLALAAQAVVVAARLRTESRGCHVRTDAGATDPAWARSVVVGLVDGELRAEPRELHQSAVEDLWAVPA